MPVDHKGLAAIRKYKTVAPTQYAGVLDAYQEAIDNVNAALANMPNNPASQSIREAMDELQAVHDESVQVNKLGPHVSQPLYRRTPDGGLAPTTPPTEVPAGGQLVWLVPAQAPGTPPGTIGPIGPAHPIAGEPRRGRPGRPDQGLPGEPTYPDQGLPGDGGTEPVFPDQGLPQPDQGLSGQHGFGESNRPPEASQLPTNGDDDDEGPSHPGRPGRPSEPSRPRPKSR